MKIILILLSLVLLNYGLARASLVEDQRKFSLNIAKLIVYADSIGVGLTGGEWYRTSMQQRYYVHKKLSKTYDSQHRSRLAVDFNFCINGKMVYVDPKITLLGKYWESLNPRNVWGGNFDGDWNTKDQWLDNMHFEYK